MGAAVGGGPGGGGGEPPPPPPPPKKKTNIVMIDQSRSAFKGGGGGMIGPGVTSAITGVIGRAFGVDFAKLMKKGGTTEGEAEAEAAQIGIE